LCCGVGKQAAEVAAHESLRLVGIGHLEGRLCGTLSGGERQRVSVARSLASCAELLLADEPTASLDAASRGDVCRGLLAAARGGVTVVVATHDPFVADQASRTVSLGSEAEGANGPR
jgi:ABC-type lipoprotein export system ATPase subunit